MEDWASALFCEGNGSFTFLKLFRKDVVLREYAFVMVLPRIPKNRSADKEKTRENCEWDVKN